MDIFFWNRRFIFYNINVIGGFMGLMVIYSIGVVLGESREKLIFSVFVLSRSGDFYFYDFKY